MNEKLRLIRQVLLVSGYPLEEVDSFIAKHNSWYYIWEKFKALALKNWRDGIKRGDKNFAGQMQLLGEVRKLCPATGQDPYSVNNNFAPKFALMFNAITQEEYFEIRRKGAKSKHQEAA